MKHRVRYSDSSMYDAKCELCHGTDAAWDDRLKYPCTGSEKAGMIEQYNRKIAAQKKLLADLEDRLKKLEELPDE